MKFSIAMYAALVILSTLLSALLTYGWRQWMLQKQIGQPIREVGNKDHYKKRGTPTMGGIAFLVAASILMLIFAGFYPVTWLTVGAMLIFGAIGAIDDWQKVKQGNSRGITPREKLVLQTVAALLLVGAAYALNPQLGVQRIPLLNWDIPLSLFAIPILAFIVVGTTNATNLTDGLDGLLTGVSLPVFFAIAILGWYDLRAGILTGSAVMTDALIFFGALLGYLFYNSNPATIMMGDVGSMGLGGALCALLLATNRMFYLLFLGGIYLMETLSVMIQVWYFRRTGGKRIFLMSPIHHHYELKGYKEQKITIAFTLISVLLSLFTVMIA